MGGYAFERFETEHKPVRLLKNRRYPKYQQYAVLLSQSLYAIPVERLNELEVQGLWLGGAPYKQQTGSPVSAVLSGMFSSNKI